MATAFQVNAFQNNAFQIESGVTPTPTPRGQQPAGKAKRRRKSIVEIDGERFEVWSEGEAKALLEQARELATSQAAAAAKNALNRANKKRKKLGQQALPTLEVAIPEIKVIGDEEIAAMAAEFQQAIDMLYLATAREVEIAYYLRRKKQDEDDEDDAMTMLLLH